MGKVVVISGGTGGLGRALAASLTPDHRVIILGRSPDKISAVASELGCQGLPCDVADPNQVADAVSAITKEHGAIDWLINNAGTWTGRTLAEYTVEEVRNELAANLEGVIWLTRAALQHLSDQAHIVTIVSAAALKPEGHKTVYAAAKSGAAGFVRALRTELADNVAVSALYPVYMTEEASATGSSYAQVADIVGNVLHEGKSADVTEFPTGTNG